MWWLQFATPAVAKPRSAFSCNGGGSWLSLHWISTSSRPKQQHQQSGTAAAAAARSRQTPQLIDIIVKITN